jgi:hypothetical protein
MSRRRLVLMMVLALLGLAVSGCLPVLDGSTGQESAGGPGDAMSEGAYVSFVQALVPRQQVVMRQMNLDVKQRDREATAVRAQEYSALYDEAYAVTPPPRYATAHAEILASLRHSANAARGFAGGMDGFMVQELQAAIAATDRYNVEAEKLAAGAK